MKLQDVVFTKLCLVNNATEKVLNSIEDGSAQLTLVHAEIKRLEGRLREISDLLLVYRHGKNS